VQSVTARLPLLMATSTFGLGRRRWSSAQQCYLRCLSTMSLSRCGKKLNFILVITCDTAVIDVHILVAYCFGSLEVRFAHFGI